MKGEVFLEKSLDAARPALPNHVGKLLVAMANDLTLGGAQIDTGDCFGGPKPENVDDEVKLKPRRALRSLTVRIQVSVILSSLIITALVQMAFADGISNGSFENGLTDWYNVGDVQVITGLGRNYVRFEESHGVGLNPAAGRSMLWQSFTIPSGTTEISFRYRMVSLPARNSPVPPDSFTAHLLSNDGSTRLLPANTTDAPDFSNGFFYADGDGNLVYDNSIVSVDAAGPDGLATVRLDVTSIMSTPPTVRLEFGFASADNGVTSYVEIEATSASDPKLGGVSWSHLDRSHIGDKMASPRSGRLTRLAGDVVWGRFSIHAANYPPNGRHPNV